MKPSHFLSMLFLLFSLAPTSADKRADSQFLRCCANLKNIATASEMYSVDFSGKYPSSIKALVPEYLRSAPTCPAAKKSSYSYRVNAQKSYIITCQGDHHKAAGFSKNQPAYNGQEGLYPRAVAAKYAQALKRYRARRPAIACQSNLKNLGTSLEMWSTDHKGRYPRKLSEVTPNYSYVIPKCPAAKRDTYSSTYKSGSNPDSYQLHCSGNHHKSEGYGANYPAYDSRNGLKKR